MALPCVRRTSGFRVPNGVAFDPVVFLAGACQKLYEFTMFTEVPNGFLGRTKHTEGERVGRDVRLI